MSDAERKAVLEEKRNVSSKISETTRYMGFGLVAVVYAILTSDSKKLASMFDAQTGLLIASASAGALAVICDYAQFFCGYLSVQRALKSSDSKYDEKHWAYKFRSGLFWVKQLIAFMGAISFAVALISSLFGGSALMYERILDVMSRANVLTLVGLALNLIGSALLYHFTIPKMQIGNAVLEGENTYILNDPGLREVGEEEWSPVFNKVIDRSRRATKAGFGLLVYGALLQIFGTFL